MEEAARRTRRRLTRAAARITSMHMPFHSFTPDSDGWATLQDEVAFANPYLEVHLPTVTSPTRKTPFRWTVCHRKAAVVVASQTADGRFVLIRQERVPIRATIWEFPAGQIDETTDHDEKRIHETGLRELGEESGYEMAASGEIISLGHFFPSCGLSDEHSHLLLVRPVVPSAKGRKLDANEAIPEVGVFSGAELRAMVAEGEIRDANSLATYARLVALGLFPAV
jgi:ADP-ribose pyrophosphatase